MRIGVVDSGIGGITTLKAMMARVGAEYYYYMDSASVPYGNKSRAELIKISGRILDYFESIGTNIIVVACNTLSSSAGSFLRERSRVPVVCIEPSIKPCANSGGRSLVIATPRTISSPKFLRLIMQYGDMWCASSSTLASLIEQNDMLGAEIEVDRLLAPIAFDNVVLGCTHYVFMKRYIENKGIAVYEGNDGVARRVASIVGENGLESNVHIRATGAIDKGRVENYLECPIHYC